MNLAVRAQKIDTNDLREAATEISDIEAILQRVNGTDLSVRVEELSDSLEKAIKDLESISQ